ncbi:MAG: hypothetical protein EBS50_10370 [Sphingomonadaceae bacterium]|nr:hypothetical protein [Sphingomonadaceae bacterium]
MFALDSYTPTLSGPIEAAGEQMRKNRNQNMAQAAFRGNSRMFRRQKGIGAGTQLDAYRAGIQADNEAAKGYANAQRSLFDQMTANADARFAYETNRAGEESSIRDLLLNRKSTDQANELELRDLEIQRKLQERQRAVENESRRLARNASMGGMLMGLFT